MDVMYYECHITIDPVFDERLEEFKKLCEGFEFKVAKLLMEKSPSTTDSFCTGHHKDFTILEIRMRGLTRILRAYDFKIRRNKIEAVVLDERFYDPAERAREKQASRDQDAKDLADGTKTREQLWKENSMFSGATSIIIGKPERPY